jgi:MFS transporter, DHA1 family, multidrug resistance protein
MSVFFGLIGLLLVPETFTPVLLCRIAKKPRYDTQNWAPHAKVEETQVNLDVLLHATVQ